MMLEQVQSILQEKCKLNQDQPVVIGFSGGADSVCLLDLLARLGYSVLAAHLDHGLRAESVADALWVQAFCAERNLPLAQAAVQVGPIATQEGRSIEEVARQMRYSFLFEQAKHIQAQAVAVAHQADDQAETVLMHLLRGTGLDGLRGMAYRSLPNAFSTGLPLVRPLLAVGREEIIAYLHAHNLPWLEDASNFDPRFFRNRLRHELIPYLETYNPQIRARLGHTAQVLQEDAAVLDQRVAEAEAQCGLTHGLGWIAFDGHSLQALPLGLQRRLLRRAVFRLRPTARDVEFQVIERAIRFLQASTSPAVELMAGLRLFQESGQVWIAAWEADLPGSQWPQLQASLPLPIPGDIQMPDGWRLTARLVPEASIEPDPYQAWVNPLALREPLVVRPRRPGDRIQPLGFEGHSIKLADLMINVKLPQRARSAWPLVVQGQEIVWLPGFRLAHAFRIQDAAQPALHLQLFQEADPNPPS